MDRASGGPPHPPAHSGFGAFCSAISDTLSCSFGPGRTAVICPMAVIYRNTRAINESPRDVQSPSVTSRARTVQVARRPPPACHGRPLALSLGATNQKHRITFLSDNLRLSPT
ncbi:hypothetical protein RR46_04466 [Papilio xuthus]|uniref:Uncharacterized protein n=1 Tax=Papilio xuthus TaxID=66420 RepID=A0A194PN27_PAPXU|nr:hypothetical protein RR46_04466 [Papilio xuthus]